MIYGFQFEAPGFRALGSRIGKTEPQVSIKSDSKARSKDVGY